MFWVSLTGATILDVVYGMDVESEGGASYFKLVEEGAHIVSTIANAGSFLGAPSRSLDYDLADHARAVCSGYCSYA